MRGVNQFVGRGRRFCQNTEPSEGILPLVRRQYAIRQTRTTDSMKTIAAGNEVAVDFKLLPVFLIRNLRPARIKIRNRDVLCFEMNLPSRSQARIREVLYDLVLRVDGDSLSACEVFEINPMAVSVESQ